MLNWLGKMLRQEQKGFTLIEIMIVVVIIGLLAAFAVPKVNEYRTKAQENSTAAVKKTIETAVAAYLLDNPDVEITAVDDLDMLKDYVDVDTSKYDVTLTDGVATVTLK